MADALEAQEREAVLWRAMQRRSVVLWLGAVAAHIGLDLVAFGLTLVWPAGGLPVAGLAIVGLAGWSVREAWRVTRPSE